MAGYRRTRVLNPPPEATGRETYARGSRSLLRTAADRPSLWAEVPERRDQGASRYR